MGVTAMHKATMPRLPKRPCAAVIAVRMNSVPLVRQKQGLGTL